MIDFWYELSSPYSYISAMRIQKLAEEKSIEVNWNPFLLGPFFKSQGWNTTPFNIQKEKGDYMWIDTKRRCEKFKIPFVRPSVFPTNSVYASRAILLQEELDKTKVPGLTKLLYQAYFKEGLDIGNKVILARILQTSDNSHLIEAIECENMREKLKQRVNNSLDKKIFGAPMFIYNGQQYWGDDRLDDLLGSLKD